MLSACGGGGGSGSPATAVNAGPPSLAPPVEASTSTFRAPCADGSPYTLVIRNGESIPPAMLEKMGCTFFRNYPKIVTRINPKAPTTVRFDFQEAPVFIGSAFQGTVTYSIAYLRDHPADIDIVTHEIVHIAQAGLDLPSWVIEGTADFLREEYGTFNQEAGWKIVNRYEPTQHYTDGYGTAASFFKWIDSQYRQGRTPVADSIHALAVDKYDARHWVSLTGYDIDTLWYFYSGKTVAKPPGAGVKPAPSASP